MEFSSRGSFIEIMEQEMIQKAAAAAEAARLAALLANEHRNKSDEGSVGDDQPVAGDSNSDSRNSIDSQTLGRVESIALASSSDDDQTSSATGSKSRLDRRQNSKVAGGSHRPSRIRGSIDTGLPPLPLSHPGLQSSKRKESTTHRAHSAETRVLDGLVAATTREEYELNPIHIQLPHDRKRQITYLPYRQKHRHFRTKPQLDDHNDQYVSAKHNQHQKPKEIHYRQLATRDNHWIRSSQIGIYDPRYPIVAGQPGSQNKGSFRAFSEMVSIPLQESRASRLLPHRFHRTVRLYGVSPLVLLSKPKKLSPITRPPALPKQLSPSKTKAPLKPISPKDDVKRVAGAEIEPRLGELGEFGFMDLERLSDHDAKQDEPKAVGENIVHTAIEVTIERPPESVIEAAPVPMHVPVPVTESVPGSDPAPTFVPEPTMLAPAKRHVVRRKSSVGARPKRSEDHETEFKPRASVRAERASVASPKSIKAEETDAAEPIAAHETTHKKERTKAPHRKRSSRQQSEVHITDVVPPDEVHAVKDHDHIAPESHKPAMTAPPIARDDRPGVLQVKKPAAVPIVPHRHQPSEEERRIEFEVQQNAIMAKHIARHKQQTNAAKREEEEAEAAALNNILQENHSTDSKGFLTSVIKNMRVVDAGTKNRLEMLSAPIFKANPEINMVQMETALKEINTTRKLSDHEIEYIKKVFELVNDDKVGRDEFVVIAALAERMTLLDQNVRLSFYDTDFAKLERDIKEYRKLFTVYTEDDGKMTYDDLNVLLLSSGSSEAQLEEIARMLNFQDALPGSAVGFLDFLSYVPFFTRLHENIVNNPFGEGGVSLEDSDIVRGHGGGLGGSNLSNSHAS